MLHLGLALSGLGRRSVDVLKPGDPCPTCGDPLLSSTDVTFADNEEPRVVVRSGLTICRNVECQSGRPAKHP